jgi:hypothetical protein
MCMTIPSVDIENIRAQIDAAREQIGRNVIVYIPALTECALCTASGYYDSLSDRSIFFTCPECKGAYWKKGYSENIILARVHWTSNEGITATPGGKYFSGDAYIHIEPEYHSLLQEAQEGGKVRVDNQEMSIVRINPEGAPITNRYKVILRGVGERPQG